MCLLQVQDFELYVERNSVQNNLQRGLDGLRVPLKLMLRLNRWNMKIIEVLSKPNNMI